MTQRGQPLAAISDPQLLSHVDCGFEVCSRASGRWAIVVDADRTLARPDTGRLVGAAFDLNPRIRGVFESHGYSIEAFARVSEIWSGIPVERYLAQVDAVATTVDLFAGWIEIFSVVAAKIPIIVVTSGIPQVWRRVLSLHGFPRIQVIGGCHAGVDEHFVGGEAKRRVVELVQARGRRVVAAGDSLIDEPMLRKADVPLIVPDHNGSVPLRQALAGVPDVRLLCHDDRAFTDFPRITPLGFLDVVLSS